MPFAVFPAGRDDDGSSDPGARATLGASVQRARTSFGTGGGGTSNAIELARRRRLGLPVTPKTFDVAGSALPMVYAPGGTLSASGFYPYQQLPLKTASKGYWPNGLIYAQPTSPSAGRIASLVLTLSAPPAAKPKLRMTPAWKTSEDICQRDQRIDIFASTMSAEHLRRLFSPSGCGWRRLASCNPPSGHMGRSCSFRKWAMVFSTNIVGSIMTCWPLRISGTGRQVAELHNNATNDWIRW